MSVRAYDAIVVGLGAMGSATLRHLACSGARVVGLERFASPHALGSSHGKSRIIREAYFEHPSYVPLVQRARALWEELEHECRTTLLHPTGGLMIGAPDGVLVRGAIASAETHGLRHEVLAPGEVAGRWPSLRLDAGMVAVHEHRAGVLLPEACVQAQLESAARHGAEIRGGEPVRNWAAYGDTVHVETARGRYRAGALVLAAGAWMPELARTSRLELEVERQVMAWFETAPRADDLRLPGGPIAIWEHAPGRFFYTIPSHEDGLKAAAHHTGRPTHPDLLDRVVDPAELAPL